MNKVGILSAAAVMAVGVIGCETRTTDDPDNRTTSTRIDSGTITNDRMTTGNPNDRASGRMSSGGATSSGGTITNDNAGIDRSTGTDTGTRTGTGTNTGIGTGTGTSTGTGTGTGTSGVGAGTGTGSGAGAGSSGAGGR